MLAVIFLTDSQKISAYLTRIGFPGTPSLTPETLHQLQRLHLQTVPYENLDIMRGVPLSLEAGALFEKIVTRRRGGYCFELNGLFAWLLRAIGFQVTEHLARFLRDAEGSEIPMRRHRVLRVLCKNGREYLCDVGVGGIIPRKPLEIYGAPLVSEQGSERYKLAQEPFFGYVLHEWRHEKWQRLYSFTDEEQLGVDFAAPSFYCETHPDSGFKKTDMAHIFTRNGRTSLEGREFRVYDHNGVRIIRPANDRAYCELLKAHFGIAL
jgi:N-hydroxyarylamine O-acetyltransferase